MTDRLVLVPPEATDDMATAARNALREAGLMPAYTDESKGPDPQPLILHQMLKDAVWPAMLAARPPVSSGWADDLVDKLAEFDLGTAEGHVAARLAILDGLGGTDGR